MTFFKETSPGHLTNMVIWHRKKSKMSQQDLALAANVSRTAIQRLEKGQLTIQLDTLLKIFNVLNIQLIFEGPLMESYKKAITDAAS